MTEPEPEPKPVPETPGPLDKALPPEEIEYNNTETMYRERSI
jgi:hypothetical protein